MIAMEAILPPSKSCECLEFSEFNELRNGKAVSWQWRNFQPTALPYCLTVLGQLSELSVETSAFFILPQSIGAVRGGLILEDILLLRPEQGHFCLSLSLEPQ
jgi:hypothetical protein